MNRRLKQFTYGAFYIVIIGAVVLTIYFLNFKVPPSCFDGKQNKGEEGIDCGGLCDKECIPESIGPLRVGSVHILEIPSTGGEKRPFSVLAEIHNPNPEHAAKDFVYRIELLGNALSSETSEQQILGVISGRDFIYAGSIDYIAHINVLVPSGGIVVSANVEVGKTEWVPHKTFLRPNIILQNEVVRQGPNSVIASGAITNKDILEFTKVSIFSIFKDEFGSIAGVSKTEISNFSSGDTSSFVIAHPILTNLDLDSTDILVKAIRP